MMTEQTTPELILADILSFHKELEELNTSTLQGIRDIGLVESAVNAPFQEVFDTLLYDSVAERAAKLCYGLIKNHGFIDGNKRTAAHSLECYLYLNDMLFKRTDLELEQVVIAVAENAMSFEELTTWMRNHVEHATEEEIIQFNMDK